MFRVVAGQKDTDEEVATVSQVAVNGVRANVVRSWSAPKDPRSIILHTVAQDERTGLVQNDLSELQSDISPKPDDVVDPREQTEKWANVRKTFGTHCEFLVRPSSQTHDVEKKVQRRILLSDGKREVGFLRCFLRLSFVSTRCATMRVCVCVCFFLCEIVLT